MTNTIDTFPIQPTPEQLQTQLATVELEQSEKVVSFIDQRGIERRPNEVAPECYASDEIQQEVGAHFIEVDRTINETVSSLESLENPELREKPFNPLTDEILKRLKDKASEQLPGLTKTEMVTEQKEVVSGKFIKRTKIIEQEVERQVPVAGHVATIENSKRAQGWETIGYVVQTNAEYIKTDDVSRFTETATAKIEELLVGEEVMFGDAPGKRLPLLATKIREAGISQEQLEGYSWDDIQQLVPEAGAWLRQAEQAEEIIKNRDTLQKLSRLETDIYVISPYACETIAAIYYDEQTIEKLHGLKGQINNIRNEIWATLNPGETYDNIPDDYVESQHRAMAEFFNNANPADTIVAHGTRFVPRIIKSGSLKPAANMEHDEFTFNTSRTVTPGQSAAVGIDGSQAVHWAGAETDASYAVDIAQNVLESNLRRELSDRLGIQPDDPWVEAEFAKGDLGASKIVMRLGDLVRQTPFGGHRDVDLDSRLDRQKKARNRYGTVELTQAGWAKVEASLSTHTGNDVAYVAAPEHRDGKELYDYSYPVSDLIFGIPSKDQETIPSALREAGWSEDQIKAQSFIYDKHRGEEQELQQRILSQPKYPHMVIVPLAKEV